MSREKGDQEVRFLVKYDDRLVVLDRGRTSKLDGRRCRPTRRVGLGVRRAYGGARRFPGDNVHALAVRD